MYTDGQTVNEQVEFNDSKVYLLNVLHTRTNWYCPPCYRGITYIAWLQNCYLLFHFEQ